MRIIAGSKKGARLKTLGGMDVRPTTDKVKESLFNILQFRLQGIVFLDLFAGSGQIGLEAVSRGAAKAVLADQSSGAVAVIRENTVSVDLTAQVEIIRMDFRALLRSRPEAFDVIFMDPPYQRGLLEEALPLAVAALRPLGQGLVICEHPSEESLTEVSGMKKGKKYRYGKVCLTVFEKGE